MSSIQSPAEQSKQLVNRAFSEIIDGRDFDVLDEVFAEDYVQHGGMSGGMNGSAELREWFEQVYAGFSDFGATVEFSLAETDRVACLVTYSGIHDGEFMGTPATDERVEITGITIYRIEDGRICEGWVQTDSVGFLQQIGAMDGPVA